MTSAKFQTLQSSRIGRYTVGRSRLATLVPENLCDVERTHTLFEKSDVGVGSGGLSLPVISCVGPVGGIGLQ